MWDLVESRDPNRIIPRNIALFFVPAEAIQMIEEGEMLNPVQRQDPVTFAEGDEAVGGHVDK